MESFNLLPSLKVGLRHTIAPIPFNIVIVLLFSNGRISQYYSLLHLEKESVSPFSALPASMCASCSKLSCITMKGRKSRINPYRTLISRLTL